MKRWIPGVIILAGILATVGFVTSNTETSLASDHVNGTGDIEESQSDGQVTEGVAFIGIALAPVSEDSGATGGALIISVVDGGPADGLLQEKDIIMAVDGVAVDRPRDVVEMVHALLPDGVVTFAVYRDAASLNIEVTAGERETTTLAFGNLTIPQLMPHPVPHKMPYFNLTSPNGLIKSEVKSEIEDGVRTVRTAVGTVSDIDVDAGTFSLVLKDGSETIQYEIDTETKVTIQQSGELSGLNTEDLTTVIDYKDNDGLWKVKSVSQGGHRDYTGLKLHKRLRGFGGIFPGAEYRFFGDRTAEAEGFHGFRSFGSSSEFFENLPEDFIYRFERFHQSPEQLEPGDEVIIEGASPS